MGECDTDNTHLSQHPGVFPDPGKMLGARKALRRLHAGGDRVRIEGMAGRKELAGRAHALPMCPRAGGTNRRTETV